MTRGHHEYKHVWENPSEDDELICEREIGNAHDTHAVALRKNTDRETRTVVLRSQTLCHSYRLEIISARFGTDTYNL